MAFQDVVRMCQGVRPSIGYSNQVIFFLTTKTFLKISVYFDVRNYLIEKIDSNLHQSLFAIYKFDIHISNEDYLECLRACQGAQGAPHYWPDPDLLCQCLVY